MGFGDMLKKVASKGLEIAGTAIEMGKEMAEDAKATKLEASKKASEEKLQSDIDEAKKAIPSLQTSVKDNCPYGECYQVGDSVTLICTCNKLVTCDLKRVSFYSVNDMLFPNTLPLIKKKAHAEQIIHHAYRIDNDAFKRDYLINFGDEMGLEVANEFLDTYMPKLNSKEERNLVYRYFGDFATGHCFQVKIMNRIKDYVIDNLVDKLNIIKYYCGTNNNRHIGDLSIDNDDEFLYEPSLYQRSLEDFEYTLTLLNATTKKDEYLRDFYVNIDMIDVDDLYDESGNIKPVGNRGDGTETLLGVVETWSSCQNSNNDLQNFLSTGECSDNTDNLIDDRLLILPELMRAHALPTTQELNKKIW